jgi:hypothetical protein
MLGNVSDQTIGEYANFTGKNPEEIRAGLNRMVRNENIQTPFVNITKAESAKINSLNGLYSSLVASKNKDAMDFLGWSPISNTTNAYSTNAVARASGSSYDNMDDINVLSKSKVTYGRYAGAEFQSLSLDELKEVMNINPTSFRNQAEIDNVTALKQRVNQYMEVLDKGSWSSKDQGLNVRVPGAEKSTKFKDVELESLLKENNIELKSIDDLLDSTKKDLNFNMARGTIGEEAEKTARNTEELLGHSKFGKAALAGIAIGLAGLMVGQLTAKPGPLQPEHKQTGDGSAPAPDGSYAPNVQYKAAQPSIPKKAVMQENNKGMRIKVSAKNGTVMSNGDVANSVNQAITDSLPNRMNVNMVSKDDTHNVDDSWMEEQFKRLIGG